ncbi:MAG: enoyl-CoA hydratase/isomerase family protein, partial [SAR202 cluster bacterium]|nr:enoyl-CoA hydratase/isomerase family protein [SAR202 cluster bacterium]
MAYEHILTRIESGVGIITLDRPEVLNAMNRKLSSELHDAVSTLNQDDEVGCLVVT